MSELDSPLGWLAIALGGAVGAVLRSSITRLFVAASPRRLRTGDDAWDPAWATLLANLTACLLLGLVTRSAGLLAAFAGVGVCGALSTFSTLCADVRRLTAGGRRPAAALYLAGHLVGGPGLLALAVAIAA